MRLLVTGTKMPEWQTFKRLLLIADEVGFMDTPSVMFPNWGTIGRDSDIRGFDLSNLPVTISAHKPPSGPADDLHLPYITADLQNPRFRQAVFDGMRDDLFASRFIQPQAKHGAAMTLGTELRRDLLSDVTLPMQPLDDVDIKHAFTGTCGTSEHRSALFKKILVNASIELTSTLTVTSETGLMPVSDDRHLCGLLAMRATDHDYVGDGPRSSGQLAIAVASALIPDEVIATLTPGDLFDYRRETKDAYGAWSTEIDRLATRISDIDPSAIERELPGIIYGEFRPRLLDYRNAMKAARDRMFGTLVKSVTKFEVPTLSLAYLASLSFPAAVALFAAALVPAVPAVVDYIVEKRDLNRTNAAAYLVGVIERAEDR